MPLGCIYTEPFCHQMLSQPTDTPDYRLNGAFVTTLAIFSHTLQLYSCEKERGKLIIKLSGVILFMSTALQDANLSKLYM